MRPRTASADTSPGPFRCGASASSQRSSANETSCAARSRVSAAAVGTRRLPCAGTAARRGHRSACAAGPRRVGWAMQRACAARVALPRRTDGLERRELRKHAVAQVASESNVDSADRRHCRSSRVRKGKGLVRPAWALYVAGASRPVLTTTRTRPETGRGTTPTLLRDVDGESRRHVPIWHPRPSAKQGVPCDRGLIRGIFDCDSRWIANPEARVRRARMNRIARCHASAERHSMDTPSSSRSARDRRHRSRAGRRQRDRHRARRAQPAASPSAEAGDRLGCRRRRRRAQPDDGGRRLAAEDPGPALAGGLALVWIAYRLLLPEAEQGESHAPAATTFWGAMRTIVIADAVMGLDNVLAVAGAAHGSYLLVVPGCSSACRSSSGAARSC